MLSNLPDSREAYLKLKSQLHRLDRVVLVFTGALTVAETVFSFPFISFPPWIFSIV